MYLLYLVLSCLYLVYLVLSCILYSPLNLHNYKVVACKVHLWLLVCAIILLATMLSVKSSISHEGLVAGRRVCYAIRSIILPENAYLASTVLHIYTCVFTVFLGAEML